MGPIFLRGNILVSFTPMVLVLLSFGISKLSHIIFRRSIRFECLYALTRYSFLRVQGSSSHIMSFLDCFYAILCVVLYVPSKVVLILFALFDVLYLPDEAYQATTWSNYFPHIY
jgi:hypothetical protein